MASSQITLVDSHQDARESLSQILQSNGYRIRMMADGRTAWHQLRDDPSELVIVDLDLDGIDGLQLGLRLRARHGTGLPLLAVSCARGRRLVCDARSVGFDECLFKPYLPADLLECIGRYLARETGSGGRTHRRTA